MTLSSLRGKKPKTLTIFSSALMINSRTLAFLSLLTFQGPAFSISNVDLCDRPRSVKEVGDFEVYMMRKDIASSETFLTARISQERSRKFMDASGGRGNINLQAKSAMAKYLLKGEEIGRFQFKGMSTRKLACRGKNYIFFVQPYVGITKIQGSESERLEVDPSKDFDKIIGNSAESLVDQPRR
jgi:hypothetical protein